MRLDVHARVRELYESAAQENRVFTPAECVLWDKLGSELDFLDFRIKAALDAERRYRLAPERMNPGHPWRARINYARRDPPRRRPAAGLPAAGS